MKMLLLVDLITGRVASIATHKAYTQQFLIAKTNKWNKVTLE